MLRITELSFPGLGIENFTVQSEAFYIFDTPIAWYAIIITFGMICAIAYATIQGKKIGITIDDICDFALWTIPIGIVGARLYYVLTSLDEFDTFAEVINIRGGGLAIYGGIIAGAATVFVVSRIKKINFLALADCVAPGVLLAQGIGRWGNFMNGEAFGAKTEGLFRMGISNIVSLYTFGTTEMVYVHPTFLYESFWNLLGVLLVYLYSRYIHKKYDGELFIMIFGWYGFGRMFIEGLRMDSLYSEIFGLQFRTSQVLAAAIFTVCLTLYIYFLIKKPTKPFFRKEVAVVGENNSIEADQSDEEKAIEEIKDEENHTDEAVDSSVEDLIVEGSSEIADSEEQMAEDVIDDEQIQNEQTSDVEFASVSEVENVIEDASEVLDEETFGAEAKAEVVIESNDVETTAFSGENEEGIDNTETDNNI